MSEDEARYCFIEILLGIQYLHNQNIIYRDIKPENIMIDMNGNLKIADFGLSKTGLRPNELATTYCGSPEYMAPEMLAKYIYNNADQGTPLLLTIIALGHYCTSWLLAILPSTLGMSKRYTKQYKARKSIFPHT